MQEGQTIINKETEVNVSRGKSMWLLAEYLFSNSILRFGLFKNSTFVQQSIEFDKKRAQPRLTEDQVKEITSYEAYVNPIIQDYTSRFVSDISTLKYEKATSYQRSILLLNDVLKKRKDISSVVNVGARIDIVSACLAPYYPDVEFISVDFREDLKEFNKQLPQHKNWRYKAGYALDLLESGDATSDLVLFSSTSVLFTPAELDSYLCAIKKNGTKVVVFNEPWWNPIERVGNKPWYRMPVKPEWIQDQSVSGGSFRRGYINYLHNYHSHLNKYGYKVTYSRVTDYNVPWRFPASTLQCIGEKYL